MFLIFLFISVIVLYYYLLYKYTYWDRKKVGSLPVKIPFGNIRDIFLVRRHYTEVLSDIYKSTKGDYIGIYCGLSPVLFVKSLDLVKDVLVKNFDSFQDRGVYFDEKKEPLSGHLFRLDAVKWRRLRTKLTPAFSSGKLKDMFDLIMNCGKNLEGVIDSYTKDNSATIQLSTICQRYTTDVISSVGFGYEANCLKDQNSVFYKNVVNLKELTWVRKFVQNFIMFVPGVLKVFPIRNMSQDSEKFYMDLVADTVKYRQENKIIRKDFMQLLINLRNQNSIDVGNQNVNNSNGGNTFTMNELSAQAYVFYIAGLETSYLTLAGALYYLAKHPELQHRLLEEIDDTLSQSKKLTYENLSEMEYLDLIISETLRLRAPLPILNRMSTKPYTIPNTDITLEPGTRVLIDIISIQTDPKYFSKPEKFDPERFSKENKSKIPQYAYMPFGEGPRNCIGMRQGKIQTKIGLISILKEHRVDICHETLSTDKGAVGAMLLVPENKLYLMVSKRRSC